MKSNETVRVFVPAENSCRPIGAGVESRPWEGGVLVAMNWSISKVSSTTGKLHGGGGGGGRRFPTRNWRVSKR